MNNRTVPTYGQLSQLTLVKYPEVKPVVRGAVLNLAAIDAPASTKEEVTVKVTHQVDPLQHTQTTVLTVAPGHHLISVKRP